MVASLRHSVLGCRRQLPAFQISLCLTATISHPQLQIWVLVCFNNNVRFGVTDACQHHAFFKLVIAQSTPFTLIYLSTDYLACTCEHAWSILQHNKQLNNFKHCWQNHGTSQALQNTNMMLYLSAYVLLHVNLPTLMIYILIRR